jgi:hypothetical protein
MPANGRRCLRGLILIFCIFRIDVEYNNKIWLREKDLVLLKYWGIKRFLLLIQTNFEPGFSGISRTVSAILVLCEEIVYLNHLGLTVSGARGTFRIRGLFVIEGLYIVLLRDIKTVKWCGFRSSHLYLPFRVLPRDSFMLSSESSVSQGTCNKPAVRVFRIE